MKSLTKFAELHKSLKKFLKKNMTFCCLFWCTGRRRLVFVGWSKTHNKNMSQFSRIFKRRRALSSKVFHWFHVAKCYSELKNEELSWKKLTPKLFGKLSYFSVPKKLFWWIHFPKTKSFICKIYSVLETLLPAV